MAYQLIFTSSPTSLNHGRSGFSTVARTRDMPERLASMVERCGVYSIPCGEIFSHRILICGNERWHVLTRMCDAGTDYTNRNNYLAHHVVVSDAEATSLVNPAEILAQWGGWVSSWSGPPAYIGAPEGLERVTAANRLPARNWEMFFGSAAKAALLGNSPAQIYALVPDARKLLNLFSESLLLNVKSSAAWDVSFTTFFCQGDDSSAYAWKTFQPSADMSDGSIDLVSGMAPEPPPGRAAEYAATGEMTNRERLNLKVSPSPSPVRLNVVRQPEGKKFPMLYVYSASAAITLSALVLVFFLLSGGEDVRGNFEKPEPLPVLETPKNAAQDSVSTPAQTLAKVMENVRANIEADKFSDAVALWDASEFAKKNPSVRSDIISDIGTRADILMRYADSVLSLPDADAAAKGRAVYNMRAARKALDIEGISRKQQREEKWENLNSRIEK